MKLTPKQEEAMSKIISGANPLLFVHLGKLLGVPTAVNKEEKERLLISITNLFKGGDKE